MVCVVISDQFISMATKRTVVNQPDILRRKNSMPACLLQVKSTVFNRGKWVRFGEEMWGKCSAQVIP
ncbi:hypothetical protein CHISP_3724 [Chitinispirillum alkaliphilum]|nr:hypothetical protein CHISP_3724 [Chitinispirillum alkaliphilum]